MPKLSPLDAAWKVGSALAPLLVSTYPEVLGDRGVIAPVPEPNNT